jgi:signal transduction histidine kinase
MRRIARLTSAVLAKPQLSRRTGLGLAISKRIIETQGGGICLESQVG